MVSSTFKYATILLQALIGFATAAIPTNFIQGGVNNGPLIPQGFSYCDSSRLSNTVYIFLGLSSKSVDATYVPQTEV